MPIYEYLCGECGHRFEETTAYEDSFSAKECPQCESQKTEKLFPVVGGYQMVSGGSSVRPKGAGSRPKGNK